MSYIAAPSAHEPEPERALVAPPKYRFRLDPIVPGALLGDCIGCSMRTDTALGPAREALRVSRRGI